MIKMPSVLTPNSDLMNPCRIRHTRKPCQASMQSSNPVGQTDVDPIFIYGSLMSSQVLQALICRVPTCQPGIRAPFSSIRTALFNVFAALLRGYERRCIKGRPYPGMTPSSAADSAVAGTSPHQQLKAPNSTADSRVSRASPLRALSAGDGTARLLRGL